MRQQGRQARVRNRARPAAIIPDFPDRQPCDDAPAKNPGPCGKGRPPVPLKAPNPIKAATRSTLAPLFQHIGRAHQIQMRPPAILGNRDLVVSAAGIGPCRQIIEIRHHIALRDST